MLQPQEAQQRGALQLLDALEARSQPSGTAAPMPPEFLEEFAARFEEEGLPDIVTAIGTALGQKLETVEPAVETSCCRGPRCQACCMTRGDAVMHCSSGWD